MPLKSIWKNIAQKKTLILPKQGEVPSEPEIPERKSRPTNQSEITKLFHAELRAQRYSTRKARNFGSKDHVHSKTLD